VRWDLRKFRLCETIVVSTVLHPKVSIGPLDYLFLERAYTDEKRDEKPLGMEKKNCSP
jgi:hypothetical protein